jgi:hypothetical protein
VSWGTTSITAKTIAGPRIDSTERCSGWNRQYAAFARFSEPRDFRVFQHNPPEAVGHSGKYAASRILWREDASRADGAVFAGTDRRWHSAEPCHPFLAVAAGRIANPLILIDEIEKAGTRSDYGRLWDCLLGFFEPETSARYPDPALQTNLDLSQISYVATANSLDPLPSPIRDRMRVVIFPSQMVDAQAARDSNGDGAAWRLMKDI